MGMPGSLDPNDPLQLIPHTLATNPEAIAILPVFSPGSPDSTLVLRARKHLRRLPSDLAARIAQQTAREGGQGNGSGPAEIPTHIEVGRLLLTIPADVADNLRGPADQRHPIWLFTVHRGVYDEALRMSESGIVLPGQVGRIVKPQ